MNIEENVHQQFEHIFQVCCKPDFLKMDALNGEIPFWIAPYDIASQKYIEPAIHHLKVRLLNAGITSLTIDLFELSCEIVDKHIGLKKMFEIEKNKTKERFKKALQSTLNIHERLLPEIRQKVADNQPQILFIKGVHAVYPFIRSHNVLNNLQSSMTDFPTVMFFPGEYSGKSLKLFSLLKDDNYYRAFNINTHQL